MPYKGTAPALNDLIAGHVDFMFNGAVIVLRAAQGGKARILAVATEKRVAALPDIPTMIEAGVPDFVSDTWNALSAPPKTPAADRRQAQRRGQQSDEGPGTPRSVTENSDLPRRRQPAEMSAFIKEETRRWSEVIHNAGIQPA